MEIKKNSLKAWVLASRPKTLTGASVPVLIGWALAWADTAEGGFSWFPAVLCMLFAFVMQIDANFINDYFDFLSGKDDDERLGPPRACAMGWIDVRAMKWGIILATLLGCLIGLPLIYYGGWEMILVGLFCVVFCFLYTTVLASVGMGDLLVLVFFGLVPVSVTYYIQCATVSWLCLVASVACGLVIDTLLIVNNYRDIDNDRRAGKNTLVVKIGGRASLWLYLWLGIVACLLGVAYLIEGHALAFFLPLLYLFIHFGTYRKMVRIGSGKALNAVLAETARNMFIYGLCVACGLLF